MAFNYVPAGNQSLQGLSFGGGLRVQGAQPQSPIDYGQAQGQQQQQQQQNLDPQQMMDIFNKFKGSGQTSSMGQGNLSGLLSSNGGSAGLGGSGLIGSSSGAVSAANTGGASYGLGGSLVGGSGTVGGSTFAAGAGEGAGALGGALGGGSSAAGGGAAAGGSALGGAAAAAGPWAALAAIIMFNEEDSRKKGLRAEDRKERTWDQLNGKVLTQDIEGKWGPMFDKWTGGNFSKLGFQGDAKGGSQIASGRIGPGIKSLWNEGTVGKLRKLF